MEHLSIFISVVLGISLAMERGIEILRTVVPRLRRQEGVPEKLLDYLVQVGGKSKAYKREKRRRLYVQFLAIFGCYVIAVSMAEESGWKMLIGTIQFGEDPNEFSYPVLLVGVLASAGSAFWREMLGFTRQIRRLREQVAGAEKDKRTAVVRLSNELVTFNGLPAQVPNDAPNASRALIA